MYIDEVKSKNDKKLVTLLLKEIVGIEFVPDRLIKVFTLQRHYTFEIFDGQDAYNYWFRVLNIIQRMNCSGHSCAQINPYVYEAKHANKEKGQDAPLRQSTL